ncbi:MAG: protein-glutamate O-methyltransferase CheR [Dehalococcoidia bacterium]|nr:protein-glutamate O-methyltransferase CheR [Dehalococcoidia bacterium]
MDDLAYPRVRDALQELLGLDLRAYKPTQMRRRLASFVARHCEGDPDVFLARLRAEPDFLQDVRDMLTINVTEFFRDPVQWATLEQRVLPALLEGRPRLRAWSAGCSHGQEPISLAIALDRLGRLGGASILATDFDHAAVERTAAGGPYRASEVAGLSEDERERYFARERSLGDGVLYRTRPRVRSRITAQSLNLLADPFEGDFDLVICRNVMIYFETEVKSVLLRRFQGALRPGGVLFIGATEALLGADLEGFERMGGNFYRRAEARGQRAA